MDHTIETPEAIGMNSKRLDRIKPAMQSIVDQGRFAGLSTMIARRGRMVHFEQVGWMDRESHAPMSADTIFTSIR